MPIFKVTSDLDMFYRIDDFADPWRSHETVLMLHGNAESSSAWFAWVPTLAREYRVVRPDMRGFGDSTPMRELKTQIFNRSEGRWLALEMKDLA